MQNTNGDDRKTPVCAISLCFGSSCFARGNEKNLQAIENYLRERGLEADVDLRGARCSNACLRGPLVRINGVEYERADEATLLRALDEAFGATTETGAPSDCASDVSADSLNSFRSTNSTGSSADSLSTDGASTDGVSQ